MIVVKRRVRGQIPGLTDYVAKDLSPSGFTCRLFGWADLNLRALRKLSWRI
jgi:hypothetical protein